MTRYPTTLDSPRTRMPSHVKTYDESGDPIDHIKLFQSTAKNREMGNANMVPHVQLTLNWECRVWIRKLPKESLTALRSKGKHFGHKTFIASKTKHLGSVENTSTSSKGMESHGRISWRDTIEEVMEWKERRNADEDLPVP
ncbi:hypothetical protein Tco_0651490 [Tanacetum coccineum]|uniref:Reverse transcriptase domain-containing protein n=1 Tax=Tanacetum coccineum TaxID=301880 RepID=A0ABQ4WUY9_9ASTR